MRILRLLVVAVVHVSAGVALYAARVKHGFGGGDFVVFVLPAIVAAIGYYIAMVWRGSRRPAFAVGAVVLAVLSFFASLLVNLNVFGS